MLAEIFFIVADVLISLFLYLVLARVLLQLCAADRYNPIAQSVVRFTDPFLAPLRRALPKSVRWDFAGIIVLFLLGLLRTLVGTGFAIFDLLGLVLGAVIAVLLTVINVYLVLIFVMVLMSFVAPGSYHPGAVLIRQLTDPLLAPVQRLLPSMGGLDLSPLVAITVLYILRDIVLPRLLSF